jgi:hypothetical protein
LFLKTNPHQTDNPTDRTPETASKSETAEISSPNTSGLRGIFATLTPCARSFGSDTPSQDY